MLKTSRLFFILLFLGLIVFGGLANIFWLIGNRSITGIDVPNHLAFSVEFFYLLSDRISDFQLPFYRRSIEAVKLLAIPVPHAAPHCPNFVYFTTSLFYFVFGRTLFVAKMSNWLYIFILLVSVYLIGKRISSGFVGINSAFLVFMYPLVFESSRQYGLDLPLTSMVALGVWALLKSNNFANSKYTVLLGLIAGVSMLVKGHAVFFLAPPVLYVLYENYKQKSINRNLLNIGMFFLIAGLISSLWWGIHLKEAVHFLRECFDFHMLQPNRYSFNEIIKPVKMLVFSSISLPLFSLFLPCFYLFVKSKVEQKSACIAWLVAPVLVVFVFSVRWPRYLMPVLPVIAIISSWGISRIKNAKFKTTILVAVMVFPSIQFCFLTFGDGHFRRGISDSAGVFGGTNFGDIKRREDYYGIEELIKVIRNHTVPEEDARILVVSLSENKPGPFEMRYWIRVEDRNWDLLDLCGMFHTAYHEFDSMDFIIFRVPRDGSCSWPPYCELIKMLKKNSAPFLYGRFSKSPLKEKLLGKLYESRPDCEKIAKISARARYFWVVYRKRGK